MSRLTFLIADIRGHNAHRVEASHTFDAHGHQWVVTRRDSGVEGWTVSHAETGQALPWRGATNPEDAEDLGRQFLDSRSGELESVITKARLAASPA